MKNDLYIEFNNGIYPCPLCIAVGKDWHNANFDEECNRDFEKGTHAYTFDTESTDIGKCVLIRFASKKDMSGEIMAHEALHATVFILDYIGSGVAVNNTEPAAYLLQWVYRCCEKVKLGKTEE